MSDTPLTDAAKEGGESWMELAALSAVLERENAELRDFVERHDDALRLLRIWAAKPMHGTNCDDLREETLAFLKTQ
jgi:hypothetical protein